MKHAYLLIIHEYNDLLEKLLSCIDDRRNDIFIHVDKKAKEFPFEKVDSMIKISKIYFIPRIKVYWGGSSQIKVELNLLEEAVNKNKYRYFHLLSGADLPLKTQDEIHKFFLENDGKEFISIHDKEFKDFFRVKYYFIEKLMSCRDNNFESKLLRKFQGAFLKIQRIFHIQRNKNYKFYKGSNWFSITNEVAKYVVKNKEKIELRYKYTFCADEIFLQSLIMNSKFKDNIYKFLNEKKTEAAMRYIDWEKGIPYTFKEEDYNILINSGMIFARKFSEKVDREIIKMIYNYIKNKE